MTSFFVPAGTVSFKLLSGPSAKTLAKKPHAAVGHRGADRLKKWEADKKKRRGLPASTYVGG
jgi:hypothetical protein